MLRDYTEQRGQIVKRNKRTKRTKRARSRECARVYKGFREGGGGPRSRDCEFQEAVGGALRFRCRRRSSQITRNLQSSTSSHAGTGWHLDGEQSPLRGY